jgi:hypothetical protein
MPDETVLIWFRFSTKIKLVPVTAAAHSNGVVECFIMRIVSLKDVIPRSAFAAKR